MKRTVLVIILFLLPFLFYWKLFALDPDDRQIFRGDFMNQHYVWKSYALDRLSRGELPLWNPHLRAGVPFHANPQVGLFYPPNYLLMLFLDEGKVEYRALEGFQLLHQGLAGLGMFLLLRSLGVAPVAAWVGALVILFTGFFATPGHHAIALTAGWVPLVLYWLKRAVETGRGRSIALAAIGIGMMMLAGHPQVAFYGLLLSAAWALYLGKLQGAALRYLPAAVLGAGLAAVQLVPTYELSRQSTRADAGYEYAATLSFPPSFLGGMVAPRGQIPLPGQDPSLPMYIYVGIGTLILAALGIAVSLRPVRWFFGSVALLSVLAAFGEASFLFDLAYLAIPGFSRFRAPFRLLGLYSMGMAGLAALGMETLMPVGRLLRRRTVVIAWAFFGLLLLVGFWNAYLQWMLRGSTGSMGTGDAERRIAAAQGALFFLGASLAVLSLAMWCRGARWPAGAMAGLLVIDLWSFVHDRGMHPYPTLARTGERRVTRILKAQEHRCRFTHRARPQSNYSTIHGVDYAGGHDSLVEEHYASLVVLAEHSTNVLSMLNIKLVDRALRGWQNRWCGPRFRSPLPLLDITAEISPIRLTLLRDLPVRQLSLHWAPLASGGRARVRIQDREMVLKDPVPLQLSFTASQRLRSLAVEVEEGNPGIRLQDLVLDGKSITELSDFLDLGNRIYLNLHCMPRAYSLPYCKPRAEENTVDSLSCWSPEEGALLDECGNGVEADGSWGLEEAQIESYDAEEVRLEAVLPRAGYVILADSFYPGWYAQLDGQRVPLLRIQHALRGVGVPEGKHRIRFIYRPLSFRIGLAISVLAALVLSAMFAVIRLPGK